MITGSLGIFANDSSIREITLTPCLLLEENVGRTRGE